MREKSENFERCGSYILSEDDGFLLIPKGFAHGFLTLTDNTKVLYKVDNYYNKEHERGIRWNDPFFNINWPTENNVVISKKDSNLPYWEEIKDAENWKTGQSHGWNKEEQLFQQYIDNKIIKMHR